MYTDKNATLYDNLYLGDFLGNCTFNTIKYSR